MLHGRNDKDKCYDPSYLSWFYAERRGKRHIGKNGFIPLLCCKCTSTPRDRWRLMAASSLNKRIVRFLKMPPKVNWKERVLTPLSNSNPHSAFLIVKLWKGWVRSQALGLGGRMVVPELGPGGGSRLYACSGGCVLPSLRGTHFLLLFPRTHTFHIDFK